MMPEPACPAKEYPTQPTLAVGAVVYKDKRILLVKRKNPPARGEWAIPGGRVRLGEPIRQAAQREVLEETGITISATDPVYSFETIERDPEGRIRFHYYIIDIAATYVKGSLTPGDDAMDARWISESELDHIRVNPTTLHFLQSHGGFRS